MIESPLLGLLLLGALVATPMLLRRARAATPDGVRVVGRTALHKGAVVAVVAVGERRLLLGAGERGVQLLTELEAPEAPQSATPTTTDTPTSDTATFSDTAGRTDADRHVTSTDLDSAAALDALLGPPGSSATADGSSATAGPGTGLVDRLRAMTVRTAPTPTRPGASTALRQVVRGAGRPTRDPQRH
jgi:flagellar biogenesis protein FliO